MKARRVTRRIITPALLALAAADSIAGTAAASAVPATAAVHAAHPDTFYHD